MSTQPVHEDDPRDPMGIYERLPEQARDKFVAEYHAAVDASHDFAGGRRFLDLLQTWSVLAAAYSKPDFQQRYEDVRDGVGEYVSMDEVFPHRPA